MEKLTLYLQTYLLRGCVLNSVSRSTCIYSHVCRDWILSSSHFELMKWEPIPLHKLCQSPYKQVLSKTYQRISVSALIWPGHCSPETLRLQQHHVKHFCFWQRLVYLALKVQSAGWIWIDVDPVHLPRTWITRAGSCSTPLSGCTCCKLLHTDLQL